MIGDFNALSFFLTQVTAENITNIPEVVFVITIHVTDMQRMRMIRKEYISFSLSKACKLIACFCKLYVHVFLRSLCFIDSGCGRVTLQMYSILDTVLFSLLLFNA